MLQVVPFCKSFHDTLYSVANLIDCNQTSRNIKLNVNGAFVKRYYNSNKFTKIISLCLCNYQLITSSEASNATDTKSEQKKITKLNLFICQSVKDLKLNKIIICSSNYISVN